MQNEEEIEELIKQIWEALYKKSEVNEEHKKEVEALWKAKEGKTFPLGNLIAEQGLLQTKEAQSWTAALVKGLPGKAGRPRTLAQRQKEMDRACEVALIMHQQSVTEHGAIVVLCEQNPELKYETLRKHVSKNKKFREVFSVLFQIRAHQTDRATS